MRGYIDRSCESFVSTDFSVSLQITGFRNNLSHRVISPIKTAENTSNLASLCTYLPTPDSSVV